MKEDFIVQGFNIPPHPREVVLNAKTTFKIQLEFLFID